MSRLINLDIMDIVNRHISESIEHDLNCDKQFSCAVVIRLYNEWMYSDVINYALKKTPSFEEKDRVEELDDHVAIFYFENSVVLFNFLTKLSEACDRTLHASNLISETDVYLNGEVAKDREVLLDNMGVGSVIWVQ